MNFPTIAAAIGSAKAAAELLGNVLKLKLETDTLALINEAEERSTIYKEIYSKPTSICLNFSDKTRICISRSRRTRTGRKKRRRTN